ncbi:MAG TPA: zinc-dependent metalloprotease, partial [Polyangiaceae bacterium]|nr:zinc-dependent metalloprotease [Polyangiaceae bacterium]
MSRRLDSGVLGLRAAALLGALALGTGCAQSIGDIDRTQPDLVSKEHFRDSQWFLRETVVDVPPTSPTTMVGDMGTLEQVVWDVQENWLVGYRAYEQVPGLDGTAASDLANPSAQPVAAGLGTGRDPNVYKGNPVVAYRIDSHVDVQRGYNARTGEQNNVISENTTDRPWYERSFMRVNWANNEVDSFLTTPGAFMPIFGATSSAAAFVPQSEGGPDSFRMELDDDGKADYIDFTVRRFVTPSIAGCIAQLNAGLGDCAGDEIKVRTSLERVDPAREQDYVPMVYDDRRQGEFGYFRVERPTYDRRLGNTFTGLIQLAGRHDIWETARDAGGQPLPYADRTLRAIQYTLSENFPDEMRNVVTEAIQPQYDNAFKKVIAAARNQTVDELVADLDRDTGNTCLFCVDPNEENRARNGDLRRNFIYWIDDVQAAGPLGFGPSSLNPETGRIVSASAYVYGAAVDRYAEQAKEIVELLINDGTLTEDDITSGDYFRNQVRSELNPIDPRKAERFAGLNGAALAQAVMSPSSFKALTDLTSRGVSALAPVVPGLDEARLRRIQGTTLEAMMIPTEWVDAAERGEPSFLEQRTAMLADQARKLGQPVPDNGPMGAFAVTNWFGPDALKDIREFEDLVSRKSLWLANFDDPAIAGLAQEMKDARLAGDDLFQALRERIFQAVMLHELGHTMGLRHNFAASSDALNFHDEYWPQRVKTIEPVKAYTQGSDFVVDAMLYSNCAIEGALPAQAGGTLPGTDVTQGCAEQRAARMSEYQYSSIMDYGGRFNADFHGLGHYDVAALASGYGDLVEVFSDEAMAGMQQGSAALGVDVREAALEANQVRNPVLSQGIENALPFQGQAAAAVAHYTNFPTMFGGYENMSKRRFMPRTDYLVSLNGSNALPANQRSLVPVKVPYLSCYDEFVDSVDGCHRWDQGADNYEIVENNLRAYREYYVFNNFQKDRVGFDPFTVYTRTLSRYFLPLTNMYQHWLWGAFVTGLAPQGTPRGDLGLLATLEGLNRLLNTMSTPEYGAHLYQEDVGEYVPVNGTCPETSGEVLVPMNTAGPLAGQGEFMSMPKCVDVPRGVGRSYFSRYDSSGYDVFRRILESGHFYDQMAALMALQTSNASVVGIGQDVNADSRTFRIPYNLVFGQDIEDLFSAIYNENDKSYALHIDRDGAVGTVVERTVFRTQAEQDRVDTLPVLVPGRTYTTRVQSLVAGMNLLDGSLTPTYAHRGQISLLGSGEERTPPPA